MRINIFVYYGAKIDKVDYENMTSKLGIEYLYQTVYSKGLTFRDIGEIGIGNTYVIGKEIHWQLSDCCELSKINNELCFENSNNSICISDDLQDEVRQKLLEINITNEPKYYIFTSIDSTSFNTPMEKMHTDIE